MGESIEVIGPNTIKLKLSESIYELISLIKPTYDKEECKFLEGNLWTVRKSYYNDKLANRTYHLINHHFYVLRDYEDSIVDKETYLKVSGRGNINEVTRDEALNEINTREGYVEDSALMDLGVETDPSLPYEVNQDW